MEKFSNYEIKGQPFQIQDIKKEWFRQTVVHNRYRAHTQKKYFKNLPTPDGAVKVNILLIAKLETRVPLEISPG
jgi:hypothetical protein